MKQEAHKFAHPGSPFLGGAKGGVVHSIKKIFQRPFPRQTNLPAPKQLIPLEFFIVFPQNACVNMYNIVELD